ncbi:glycosyltransferase [uncultured Phocaeicola sp.]|uniref:glycosyltransferase n=1 Tax=uncultured Phocaeicola sp. TaxID=990718 RepID=UPI0014349443|nr:glycosyltransferase [uncultured Phocaeicola sp.]GFH99415.1 D-inositol 3-phosphate glycosyltransferase [Bacteroidaceae bacterium]
MKIVHIQASMPPSGNAAYRLSTIMRNYGLDSYVLNLMPSFKKDNAYVNVAKRGRIFGKIVDYGVKKIKTFRIRKDVYFYTPLPAIGRDLVSMSLIMEADVIYVHWVSGLLSIDNIENLAKTGKPIFFFMHDMWTFTGGCHHSMECEGYHLSCENCNMFEWHSFFPCAHLKSKERLFSKYSNLNFISPSRWMASCAKKSFALRNKIVYTIPNVIDETIFKPIDKKVVRQILNLPQDRIIITFGCVAGQDNPYKGWKYLEEAINRIDLDNILVVVYGSGYNQETVDNTEYPIRFLGRVYDDTMLSLICNASDLFVTPSLCESFSLVILENILCGTPVVGFDTTGIPELVKTGQTGYLAKFKDSDDLAKGIRSILNKEITFDMGQYRNSYSSRNIIESHIKLINQYLKIE